MRKAIKKSVRFEVFKRDSFTCQYCGAQAPDVVLEIDHISPVAGGGNNDILNLITSCKPCNSGKGARRLDDNSALAKQKAQLDELNARREQIEMMLSWREALNSIDDVCLTAVEKRFTEITDRVLTPTGKSTVRKWLKSNNLETVLNALDDALGRCFISRIDEQGVSPSDLAGEAIRMVPRLIVWKKRDEDRPYLKDLFYARGILRNRFPWDYNRNIESILLLETGFLKGLTPDQLNEYAKLVPTYDEWCSGMAYMIEKIAE